MNYKTEERAQRGDLVQPNSTVSIKYVYETQADLSPGPWHAVVRTERLPVDPTTVEIGDLVTVPPLPAASPPRCSSSTRRKR